MNGECQHFLTNCGTNHKLRKKLANEKHLHMSLRLCGIEALYCALIFAGSLECLQRRLQQKGYTQ